MTAATGRALYAFAIGIPASLTFRQVALLMHLAFIPGLKTVRGVAKDMGVGKPVVTRMVNAMPEYVRRRKDQNDLRSVDLSLTAEGREFAAAVADRLALSIEGEK